MRSSWASELQAAETARRAGNEGMARVCARRAAGAAAREFLIRNKVSPAPHNAFQALLALAAHPGVSADLRQVAERLTMQVNDRFNLPVEADLIQDARFVCDALMPE